MNIRTRIIDTFIHIIEEDEEIPIKTVELIKENWKISGSPSREEIRDYIKQGVHDDSEN